MNNKKTPQRRVKGATKSLLATAAIVGLAVTGCTGQDPQSPDSTDNLVVDTAAVVSVDVPVEPTTLDPLYGTSVNDSRVTRLIYDTLYEWQDDGSLVPNLAAEMPQISDDLMTYTIPIRQGVKFHDGTPFDAHDVKFTFDLMTDPDSGAKVRFPVESTISVPDDFTIVIELTEPYADLDARLAQNRIISKSAGYVAAETYGTHANGTGPFSLKEWRQGQYIELQSNREHHLNPPSYEALRFNVIPETTSRLTRLNNGETHLLMDVDPKFIDLVTEGGNNVQAVDGNLKRMAMYAGLDADRPTSDVNLRKAIAYAIDRQAIIDHVYDGHAVPISTYLQPGANYYNEELGSTFGNTPDLDKARDYLEKAGGPPSRTLELFLLNVEDQIAAATIIQANLAEIGIDVELVPLSAGALLERTESRQLDLQILHQASTSSAGLAPYYVYNGLYSTYPANRLKFNDPTMDELLVAAMQAPYGDEAAAAWEAVQRRDTEMVPQIQVVASKYIEAWSPNIANYTPAKVAWLNNVAKLDVMKSE